MKRWQLVVMLTMAMAGAAFGSVFISQASGGRAERSGCKPSIDQLISEATSDTTAVVTATVSSLSGGSWEMHLSSPETTTVGGTFSGPEATIQVSFGSLLPGTHYRGTLSISGDCGGASAEIEFRTPAAPPRPTCSAPPTIDSLQVGSVAVDSAVIGYSLTSGGDGTLDVTVSPGGTDVAGTIAPPGASSQVPLAGLTPNTTYTVVLVARNGCGESSRQTTFTTLRLTDCTGPPGIPVLRVTAIRERSATLSYSVNSDGAGAARITVGPGRLNTTIGIAAPAAAGTIPLSKLNPGTRYAVRLTASNQCGEASVHITFTSLGLVGVSIVGHGRVTSSPKRLACTRSCTAAFKAGSTVRLEAKAAAGFRFAGWSGDCRGPARVCTLKARNEHVSARFEPIR